MAPLPVQSRDPLVQGLLKLNTPNVSDALDRLGIRGAPHGIGPLRPGYPKIVGRAMARRGSSTSHTSLRTRGAREGCHQPWRGPH